MRETEQRDGVMRTLELQASRFREPLTLLRQGWANSIVFNRNEDERHIVRSSHFDVSVCFR